ncbi:MAG: hypothetical protein MR333_05310 [Porphyromonadaceae bacterium]|jgi:hypothetical protein|nr:hypothetical protein [Porphyromonadaceae bacterium]
MNQGFVLAICHPTGGDDFGKQYLLLQHHVIVLDYEARARVLSDKVFINGSTLGMCLRFLKRGTKGVLFEKIAPFAGKSRKNRNLLIPLYACI